MAERRGPARRVRFHLRYRGRHVVEGKAPDALVEDFVEVFGSWADLRRQEKRVLLREWRIEIVASVTGRPYHRRLQIERVRAGTLPAHLWLYKKMKRLNIE